MKIIKRGAEAVLYQDGNTVVKERIKKSYRIDQIDDKLRKERTRKEVKLLNEARRTGILTPKVLDTDEKNNKIIMEFIDGQRLKDILNSVPDNKKVLLAEEIGENVGKLHEAGIIHGDLTTSNIMIKNNQMYFIDFGLGEFSKRTEDFAIDLSVLKEAFKSTHFKYLELLWKSFIRVYSQTFSNHEKVLKALEEIEKRGRYIKRD